MGVVVVMGVWADVWLSCLVVLSVVLVGPCFLTPMILFSGLLYQRSSVPPYLAWMQVRQHRETLSSIGTAPHSFTNMAPSVTEALH